MLPETVSVPVACRLPKYPFPTTVSALVGDVVPIPTFPLPSTVRSEAPVDEATVNGLMPEVPWTRNVEVEVVALMPDTVPLSRKRELMRAVPFHFDRKPLDNPEVRAEKADAEARPSELVETADTAPLVPQRRPDSDATERPLVVVVPVIVSDPVVVRLDVEALPRVVWPDTASAPAMLEVAVVEVETMLPTVAVPLTTKAVDGVDEPMPTLPPLVTVRLFMLVLSCVTAKPLPN